MGMYVVDQNINVDTKLATTMKSTMMKIIKTEPTAKIDVAFTKATTFQVDAKGPGNMLADGPESVGAIKFLKDLTKIACPENRLNKGAGAKVDSDAPEINPDSKGCTATFTKSSKVNEFGAWTFTVQVVQPVDPAIEIVEMEHIVKSGLEARTGVSLLGYDFPIKKVTLLKMEVAADVCVTLTELTLPGKKSGKPAKCSRSWRHPQCPTWPRPSWCLPAR